MAAPITVVDDERCGLHEPGGEVWVGVRTAGTEVPARRTAILEALADLPRAPAVAHGDESLLAVHDDGLVAFLRGAWDGWVSAGLPDDPGQDRVVPYLFPTPGLLHGLEPFEPAAAWARTGFWCFDTMTLIGPGTWEAARAAADCALTAADLVLAGAPAVYALTRPPGHHVTRTAYGGSCYLNNGAIAASRLREGGCGRVGIVDVDAHHGNGAQAIFWERSDVPTASVHVDPEAGWFPHVLGRASERGGGDGLGANRNLPLPPGAGDRSWLEAVRGALRATTGRETEALVVALGVDAAAGDPESPLRVSLDGYREAGRLVGAHGLPTVVVQEGGYDLRSLGALVRAFLEGLADTLPA